MFYGLLLEASARSTLAQNDDHFAQTREPDATWLLGLEAWVQVTVATLWTSEAPEPVASAEHCPE